ncbi:MAG: hypothetical protein ACE5IR_17435 [bacterium]
MPPTAKKEEALPPKLEPTINFQVETEFVPTNKIQKEISHKPVEKKVEKAIPPLTPPTLNTDAQVVRKPAPKLTQPNLIPQREQQPQFVKKPSSFGALCDKLLSRVQRQSGRLAIIGSDWQQRQALISTLTAGQYSQKNIGNTNRYPLEVGKIETENKHVLEIVGFSTKSKYLQMLDEISETLVGYIVLVACDDPPALGYLGYLISTLKKKFGLPHIIAVYRPAGRKPVPLDVLRYTLKTDESDAFAEFDAQDVQSVMHVFEQLLLSNKPGLSP